MPTKKIIESKYEGCMESCQKNRMQSAGAPGGAVYGIGLFGAAYYFFPQAVGASEFFIAILKTIVWPALLVFQALSLLKL